MSDRAALARVAARAGLPAERAAAILASDEYADAVRADERMFQQAGISAVPAIIFERRHLVSGGQPVEVFERVLRELAAAKRSALPAT